MTTLQTALIVSECIAVLLAWRILRAADGPLRLSLATLPIWNGASMVFGSKAAQTPSEGSQQSSSNAGSAVAHVGGLGAGHHRELYRS